MELLTATSQRQGDHPGDFCFTVEGELVLIGPIYTLAVVLNAGDRHAHVRLPVTGVREDGDGDVRGAEAHVAPHSYLLLRPA